MLFLGRSTSLGKSENENASNSGRLVLGGVARWKYLPSVLPNQLDSGIRRRDQKMCMARHQCYNSCGSRPHKKAAWSVRHGHPTELPTPRGPGVRFCWSEFLLIRLENDLFRPESQGTRRFSSGIQGQAEAVVVRAVRRVVRVAVCRPAFRRVVVPTAATVHAVRALMDHSPPMVVTRNSEIANSSPRLPAKTPSTPPDAAAGSTR